MPMAYVLINAEIGSEEALAKELLKVVGGSFSKRAA